MITKKTKYALRVLETLAGKERNEPQLIADLSAESAVPKKFLELILLELKGGGIVQSKKGPGGGYYLAVAPEEVRVADVMRLTGGAIDAVDDATHILEIEGSASSSGVSFPFAGVITIGQNRLASGALPGASPICRQRIVSPIAVDVAVAASGGLLVRVDPRALFVNVDFGALLAICDETMNEDKLSVYIDKLGEAGFTEFACRWLVPI